MIFAAGLASAAGFAPLSLWPLTLAGIAVLLYLIADAPNWRRAALLGWVFGVGHFAFGNGWIATAFTYQAEMPAWLGWIAVFMLALYLAVYPMLAAVAAWAIARRSPLALVLAFASLWTITEWLRSWVFTGFVWNPLGMIALGPWSRPGLALLAPWLGTYALSALAALLGGCWWLAVLEISTARRIALALAPFLAVLAPQLYVPAAQPGTLPYTLVQPNIPQDELTDPTKYESQFRRTAQLSLARHPGQRRLVLWPESGVPDYLRPGYPELFYAESTYAADPKAARERIGRVIGPGSLLLTGAVDLVMRGRRVVAADNAVTALDGEGRIRSGYVKAHLVPYGEYLPMRGLLEPLGASRLVAGSLDFRSGPGPRTLDLQPWGRIGVQICYEIIFSGQVVERGNRPDFLFNPSNDGWFGRFGPPQHLAQARMRAIEEGLPILRATTTGISAAIDANGVVRQTVPQHRAARMDAFVPRAKPPTPFARTGNMLPLGWAIVLLALSLVALRRRPR
ncbi:apolipoprotein N-acyltransferase [Novosphingobium sp. Gsoil 351]|nr:apolipoprotein N-acyltransferase [Novosphingobium sp. Gsoil 351]